MTHRVASVTLSDLLTMTGGFIAEDGPQGLQLRLRFPTLSPPR